MIRITKDVNKLVEDNIKLAYSIDPTAVYKVGDYVLVKIPENDMSNKLLIEKLATTEDVNLSLDETYEIPLSIEIPNYNSEEKLTWEFNINFPVSCNKIKIDIEAIKNSGYILTTNQNYFTLKTESQELCSFENFLGNYYNKKELYDTKADSIMKEEKESVFLVVFVSEEDE